MTSSPAGVTQMLIDWRNGDKAAFERLMPLVYAELRRLAASYLRRQRSDHTLQPTALVHEAYLRLVDEKNIKWQNRAHFYGMAAQMMRSILIDYARNRAAMKRGGGARKLSLSVADRLADAPDLDLVALDDALKTLAAIDPRQGRIVELRFFGGLGIEDTAEVLQVSPATVKREWRMAKAWLYQEIANK
jgi:RNA polymerase sigma factor (TIGR02999 family)